MCRLYSYVDQFQATFNIEKKNFTFQTFFIRKKFVKTKQYDG